MTCSAKSKATPNRIDTTDTGKIFTSSIKQWDYSAQFFRLRNDPRPHLVIQNTDLPTNDPVLALFDTGSTVSIIREDVMKAIIRDRKVPTRHTTERLDGAFGGQTRPDQQVQLNFNIAGEKAKHWFFVAAKLSSPCIIGDDLISSLGLRYDPNRPKTIITNDSSAVLTLSSVSIPAFSHQLVECQLATPQEVHKGKTSKIKDYVVENLTSSPTIPTCLINSVNFSIPIYNLGPDSLELSKYSTIAEAYPVDKIEPIANLISACSDTTRRSDASLLTPEKKQTIIKDADLSHLSPDDRQRALDLLFRYHDCISQDKFDLGKATSHTHKIQMRHHEPVYRKQFRIPENYRKAIIQHVQELQKLGVIKHSVSAYNSPIFCVAKKNNLGLRIVQDFREVNLACVPEYCVNASVDECIDRLGSLNAKVMSTIDLTSGFWQLGLDPSVSPITAFTIPGYGRFEYTVCPQGLLSSPAGFSTLMQIVTRGLTNCISYLDDLVCASTDMTDHLIHLEALLQRLRKHGLKINLRKCEWVKGEINYLGYSIGPGGISPGKDKLDALRKIPPPETRKQVLSFLGLANYFSKVIKDFWKHKGLLTALTRKGSTWKGGPLPQKALEAFHHIKKALLSDPVVRFPKFDQPFILTVDAATGSTDGEEPGGMGAVLSQLDTSKQEYVVSYAGRTLKPHENNYSAFLLEHAAICFGLEYYDVYLKGGQPVTVRCDHKPLEKITGMHTKTLCRLRQLMGNYRIRIEHIPGKENSVADFISRHVSSVKNAEAYLDVFGYSHQELQTLQNCDRLCKCLLKYLQDKTMPSSTGAAAIIKALGPKCLVMNDLLFYKPRDSEPLLFVPQALTNDFLTVAHDCPTTGGHAGIEKTNARLKTMGWWPTQLADTATFVQSCDPCQRGRNTTKQSPNPILPLPQTNEFNCRVHTDLFGPLQPDGGFKYIQVITDSLTKYTVLVPLPDKTAPTVAEAIFKKWVMVFGSPVFIVSDQGKEFCNQVVGELLTRCGVQHINTTAYHPQSNAQSETFNRTIVRYLRSFIDNYRSSWVDYLPSLMFSYNTARHTAIKSSPFFTLFGRHPRFPYSDMESVKTMFTGKSFSEGEGENVFQKVMEAQDLARRNNMSFRDSYSHRFNTDKEANRYTVGQLVLLHAPQQALRIAGGNKATRKFVSPFIGPYEITRVIKDSHNAVIKLPSHSANKQVKVHFDRIKPYVTRERSTHTPQQEGTDAGPPTQTSDSSSEENRGPDSVEDYLFDDDNDTLWTSWHLDTPLSAEHSPDNPGHQSEPAIPSTPPAIPTTNPQPITPEPTDRTPSPTVQPPPVPSPTPSHSTPSRLLNLAQRLRPRTSRQQGPPTPLPDEATRLIGRKTRKDKGTKRK